MARKTYRVNADRWDTLRDILVGTPDDFNTDSATVRGRMPGTGQAGRLPMVERIHYTDAFDKGHIAYTIYSYDTPIAWRYTTNDVWHVPDIRYSVTTSKHQGKVRTAISQITGGEDI